MKKKLTGRTTRIFLSVCLIFMLIFSGVMLADTNIVAAVTGSGTSNSPYVSDTPIEIEKGITKNNSLYSSLKTIFGEPKAEYVNWQSVSTFSVGGIDITNRDNSTTASFSDGTYNIQWKVSDGWLSSKNQYGKVAIKNYYNLTLSLNTTNSNGVKTDVTYDGKNYTSGIIKVYHSDLASKKFEIPAPADGYSPNIVCSGFTVAMEPNANGNYDVTLTPKADAVSGVDLTISYEQNRDYNITLNANRTEYGNLLISGSPVTSGVAKPCTSGTKVMLTADPKEGCSFYGWFENGILLSESENFEVSVLGDATYEAKFYSETDTFAFRHEDKLYLCSDLDEALEKASSSSDKKVVMVASGIITESVEIPSGVTLLLPYAQGKEIIDSTYGNCVYTDTDKDSKISLPFETATTNVVLTVDENVTLMIAAGGKLILGGELGSNGSSGRYSGHTKGMHSDILLKNNSQIYVKSDSATGKYGEIKTGGYIVSEDVPENSTDKKEGSIIVVGGKIWAPFIVNDFAGGSYTQSVYNAKRCPFNLFTMLNVQSPMTLDDGAALGGLCNLYAGSKVNKTAGEIIGPNNAIITTETDSVVNITYDDSRSLKKVKFENKSTVDDLYVGHSNVTISGGATFGSLSLTIDLLGLGALTSIKVNTDDVPFPLPYNISLNLENGTYTVPNVYKIMPGATVYVAEDAVVNMTDTDKDGKYGLYVYNGMPDIFYAGSEYPSDTELETGGYSAMGHLIVDGTLNLNASEFAGVVETNSKKSTVSVGNTSIDKLNLTIIESSIDNVSEGKHTNYSSRSLPAQLNYLQYQDKTGEDKYVAMLPNTTYYGYYAEDDNGNPSVTSEKTGYEYVNLNGATVPVTYLDKGAEKKEVLEGAWLTPRTVIYMDGDVVIGTNNNLRYGADIDTVFTDSDTAITVNPAEITKTGYTLVGWKDADGNDVTTVPIDNVTTVYAQWSINQYTITFDSDGGTDVASITQDYGTEVSAPSEPTKRGYKFAGWSPALPETMPAENKTHTAAWTPLEYKLILVNGSYSVELNRPYNSELKNVDYSSFTAATGYEFDTWCFDSELKNPVGDDTMPDKDTTLYARWKPIEYTITLNTYGGTFAEDVMVPVKYTTEESVTIPNPARNGYDFLGWMESGSDDANLEYVIEEGSTGNLTLDAKWKPIVYEITYDLNGGSLADGVTNLPSYTIESGNITLNNPTKVGHTFAGWTGTGLDAPTENVMIAQGSTGNREYTATWTEETYTIQYNSNGGTAVGSETVTFGGTVNAPTEPTRTGYTFAGWFDGEKEYFAKDENGNATSVTITDLGNDGAELTLTATWTPHKYTLEFGSGVKDNEGVTGGMDSMDIFFEIPLPLPQNAFGRTGYTFSGWKWNDETIADEGSLTITIPPNDNLVSLIAQWTIETYTIKFDSNGGSNVEPAMVEVEYGKTVEAPTEPTRTGYTFAGWFDGEKEYFAKDENGNAASEIIGDLGNDRAELTLTAAWDVNNYNIIFMKGYDDEVIQTRTYLYGSEVEKTYPTPERNGYTFNGWDKEIPGTMPAEDVTITAQWIPVRYNITYDLAGGSVETENPATYEVETEDFTLTNPTRNGYDFAGWRGTGLTEATESVTITIGSTGDRKYTARWTPIEYSITYNGVDSDYSGETTYTIESGDLSLTNPTRNGYTFAGWTGTGLTEASENVVIAQGSTGDREYTATWTPIPYTLTLHLYDEVTKEITVDFGAYILDAVANTTPTRTGYTFNNTWYDDSERETEVAANATMPENGTTIYAGWTANTYNVTFDANGGNAIEETVTVTYDGTYGNLPTPTRTGYTFAGWYLGNEKITSDSKVIITEDSELKAFWDVNEYTITFNTNGGSEVSAITRYYGADIPSVTAPTKTGYTFAGWEPALPETMPAGDMTITAKWKANTYVVNFDVNGGNDLDGNEATKDVTFDQSYGDLPTPSRIGYTFTGWKLNGEEVNGNTTVKTAENHTLVAQWAPITYTIQLDYGYKDESGNDKISSFQAVYDQQYYNLPQDDVTRVGYRFDGWFRGESVGSARVNKTDTVTDPVPDVLYAHWTAAAYQIEYVLGGGENHQENPDAYNVEDLPFTLKDPSKTGYNFIGWTTDTITIPQKITIAENTTGDLKFIANWQADQFNVIFKDGDEITETREVTFDTSIGALPDEPTKEGYSFEGWFTAPNGGGEKVSADTVLESEGATYYAHWTINQYTITFANTGDTEIAPITQDYGTTVTKPANPSKTGHTFAGWDKEIPATMPAEDITITAQWNINQYTITFADTGDTTIAPITQDYNTAVTAPTDPTKTGYTFAGWDVAVPETMPAENITITAQWTVNQYAYSFIVDGETLKSESVDYGTAIVAPADPIKEGHTFTGWNPTVPATMPASNQTFTAQWDINQYTITFANTGDSTIAEIKQDYGTDVEAPTNPTKEGYTFNGWDKEIPGTMPAEDMTITAQWTVNQYNLTKVFNNGLDDDTTEVDYGTAISTVLGSNPSRTGHTFDGWYTDEELTTPLAADAKMGVDGFTVYAKWTANKYKLTLDANEGTLPQGADSEQTLTYGEEYTLPIPEREGYTFKGWFSVKIGDGLAQVIDENSKVILTADTTIYAQWTVNQYTITFDTDGGSDIPAIKQNYGTAVTAPADPTKTGYTFAEWDKEIPATMPAEDITITAQWKINQYTITFANTGDTEIAPIMQDYNTAVTAPADPVKTGYTFAGWDVAVPETMPAEDITITAQWNINQYTITFDTDGGSDVPAITQNYGTDVTAPADPTKTGYTFAGWDVDVPETMPAEDMSIKAKWTVNQYTITFDSDGGSAVNAIKQDYNTAITAPADPVKTGYTFAGWEPEIPSTMPAGDMSIKAKWNVNRYTITFDTDGGSDVTAITQNYGAEIRTPADPTKPGYTFAGWEPEIPSTMPAGDMSIKAKWKINQYTLTFDTAGGSSVSAIKQDYNSAITAPADPTREGYTFAGWSPAVPATMPAANTVITAQWTINQYTITFNTDGGSAVGAITQDYGSTVTTPANPTKVGHTFAGWSPSVPVTMPANDTQVTAQWTVNQYTITFDTDGGSPIAPVKQNYNTQVEEPAAPPTKDGYRFDGWDTEFPITVAAQDQTVTAKWTSYLKLLAEVPIEQVTVDQFGEVGNAAILDQAREYYMLLNEEQVADYTAEGSEAYSEHKTRLFELIEYVSIVEMQNEILAAEEETNALLAEGAMVDGAPLEKTIARMKLYVPELGQGVLDGIIIDEDCQALTMLNIEFLTTLFPYVEGADKTVTIGDCEPYPLTGTKVTDNTLGSDQFNIMLYIAWVAMEPGQERTVENQNAFLNRLRSEMNTLTISELDGASVPVVITAKSPEGVVYSLTCDINFFNEKHDIHWMSDGSEFTTNSDVAYGTPIYSDAIQPTKVGYTLTGWKDADGNDVVETMGKTDLTYYAQWLANTYTVSLDANGGTVSPESVVVTYDGTYAALPTPSRDGYGFKGWFNAREGGTQFNVTDDVAITSDITLYAQWNAGEFTIKYDVNGGVPADNPTSYKTDSETFTLNNPTREGYTFTGWTGTGLDEKTMTVVIPSGSYGEREYTANWQINSYNVSFDANGGAFANETTKVDSELTFGSAIVAPADPTKEGHTFAGWSPAVPDTVPAADQEFTAQWTVNRYTITFITDGGSAVDAITQDYNSAITAPADPSKDGYTFAGWYTNEDFTGDVYEFTTMPLDGITLYAKWNANEYTITFDGNGGSEVGSITQDYGSSVVAPDAPSRTGYSFIGWEPELPKTMPLNGSSHKALWNANTYILTLDPGEGTVNPETVEVTYDAVYGELPVPVREGYDFAGWIDENDKPIVATDVVKVAAPQSLKAVWNASGDTPYTVNHYQQDVVGDGYSLMDTDNLTGATESEVKAAYKAYEGFHVNETLGNVSDVITADGKLVLNVYYDRDVHNITWIVRGGESITESYRYGATPNYTDTAWETDIHAAYTFTGWDKDIETVTGDATYTAKYNKTFDASILGNPDVTYGKLKDALANAKANDVVRLERDLTLTESLVVPTGVTLVIPCMDNDPGYVYHTSVTGNAWFNPDGGEETNKTSQEVGPAAKLYRKLIIPEGVSLIVNGTVMVNAVTGRPSAGDYDQDITGGYSQIDLDGNVVVENDGKFDNFGYVKGNGSVTAKFGGSVGDLFIVRSWRGGTQASNVFMSKEKVYPMNEYDCHNIEADVIVEYGADYYGLVKMYASNSYHYTKFSQVNLTNGLIRPTEEDSYVIRSYENGYENYSLYGGGAFGSGTLTAAGITLSSAEVFYPWDGDIRFDLYDGEYHFIENTYHEDYINGFKFLTGSGVTVHSGADLIVDPGVDVVFYQEFNDNVIGSTRYPDDREPAVLTIKNGASFRNAGTFSGHIYTESPDVLIGALPNWGTSTYEADAFPSNGKQMTKLDHELSITRPGYDWKFGDDKSIIWIGADYNAVNAALAKVPADLDCYSIESKAAVEKAVSAVVYDLPKSDQTKVEQWAKDIETAVAALQLAVISISFDPGEGLLNEEIILTKTYGEPYGMLPIPTREGYIFIGWYTSMTGGTRLTETSLVSSNVDHMLYARYSKIDAEPANPGDYSKLYEAVASVPEDLGGYTDETVKILNTALNAWEDGLTEEFQSDIDAWTQAILDAVVGLKVKTFIVTYDANGGAMVGRTFEVAYGELLGELETPIRDYHTFAGWYTEKAGGELVTSETVMSFTSDITIYAHWDVILADYSPVDDILAVIPEDYAQYYDEESVERIDTAINAVDDRNLSVEYQEKINAWGADIRKAWNDRLGKRVTVYYDPCGGSIKTYSKSVRYDSSYGNLPEPTHNEGYTFIGWYTEKDGGNRVISSTKVAVITNHNIYAHWDIPAADYSAVDASIAKIPKDLSIYTDASVNVLQNAINAVERGLLKDRQNIVDGWAKGINDALAGLTVKTLPFTDVTKDDWFYDTIFTLYHAGIVNGMTETTYGPQESTTRGQMAALLYRISGNPAHNGTMPFTDVPADQYYYDPICWGYEIGVLKGTSTTIYAPDDHITREQFATMLYRLYGEPATNGNLNSYVDASEVSEYAVNAMKWCVEVGIINGITPTTLAPGNEATRAEVATMLLRYMNLQ